MIQEHRASRRVDVEGEISLVRAHQGPRLVKAYLDDISLGGFQMYAVDNVDIGEEVDFELITPLYRDPLAGKGKVKYSRPVTKYNTALHAMGVEFDQVKPRQIKQLLKMHTARRSKPGFLARHKKELRAFLFFLPLVIAISIASGTVVNGSQAYALRQQQDQAYIEKAKDALIYFLYHAQ